MDASNVVAMVGVGAVCGLFLGWLVFSPAPQALPPAGAGTPVAELRRLIADDAYACTFQTFGQYRTALLKAADKIAADGVDVPPPPSSDMQFVKWQYRWKPPHDLDHVWCDLHPLGQPMEWYRDDGRFDVRALYTPKDGVDVPVPPSGEAEYQSWLPVGKHAPEKVYYMRDNHTFRALPLDVKGACEAIREEFADGESYGMLCTKRPGAAAPLHAGKELAEFLPRAREWLVAEFAARGVDRTDEKTKEQK